MTYLYTGKNISHRCHNYYHIHEASKVFHHQELYKTEIFLWFRFGDGDNLDVKHWMKGVTKRLVRSL